MNLADAIRKAAQETGTRLASEASSTSLVPEPKSAAVVYQMPTQLTSFSVSPDAHGEEESLDAESDHPLMVEDSSIAGLVKIEVHVPPDQLSKLLKSVVATQHSVLTLREAAYHLRITPSRLEELAKEGKIPGFLVDGKWRFSRAKLDRLNVSSDSE